MLAVLFIVLLAQVTRKENKGPQSKGCNTREGRRYFCLSTSPGISALGFSYQRQCARRRETSPLSVPEFRAPNTGIPCVTERRESSGGLVSPHIRRADFVSHAAPLSPPFDNLQLLQFFTDISCFPLSLLNAWRG